MFNKKLYYLSDNKYSKTNYFLKTCIGSYDFYHFHYSSSIIYFMLILILEFSACHPIRYKNKGLY